MFFYQRLNFESSYSFIQMQIEAYKRKVVFLAVYINDLYISFVVNHEKLIFNVFMTQSLQIS